MRLSKVFLKWHRKGKFKASLFNLQLVNSMEDKLYTTIENAKEEVKPDIIHQIATTHSNICAIHSEMGEHDKALK